MILLIKTINKKPTGLSLRLFLAGGLISALIITASAHAQSTSDRLFIRSPDTINSRHIYAIPAHNTLWHRLRRGFALHIPNHHHVNRELRHYLQEKKYIQKTLQRSKLYLYYIVKLLELSDIPLELAFLPMVESSFNPFAYSKSHAAGLWQFIPPTAAIFDLERNHWYDARRDIRLSTQAAVRYLVRLNKEFDGDWLLTLAAYNGGEGTVRRAIKRNRRHGKRTDFWSLKLPRETRQYVPRLLAFAKLIRNARHYGLRLPHIANENYWFAIDVGRQIDLIQLSQLMGMNIRIMQWLNPSYFRYITPPGGPHKILIPRTKITHFRHAMQKMRQKLAMGWQPYSIRRGDTLAKIAQKYHTSVDVLKRINFLKNNRIYPQQWILVPVVADAKTRQKYFAANKRMHIVQSGENLSTVAAYYGARVRQLMRWNNIRTPHKIYPSQVLVVGNKHTQVKKIPYKPQTTFPIRHLLELNVALSNADNH